MESVADRFIPLVFLVLTAAGWYAASRWLIAAAEQIGIEGARAREAAAKANKTVLDAEASGDRDALKSAQLESRDAEIADKMSQLQLSLLFRYFSIFWFAIFVTLSSAVLSVMNVVIAIPLGLIAILAVTSQFSAAMFSIYSSWYKTGHPVQSLLRRTFGILILLGVAYPILLIVISRIMLIRNMP